MTEELYSTPEWFESLKWQRMWIGYMAGWWVGEYGLPRAVIDFGCGDGWWPKCFHDMGSTAAGVELNKVAADFVPEQVSLFIHDLRDSLWLHKKADLVMCLEVAEHMNKHDSDTLCQTLVAHCDQYILFSAAGPGQEGTGHINLQPQSYWRKRIERHGRIAFSPLMTGRTREAFEKINNELFQFLPRNLMVFCRI